MLAVGHRDGTVSLIDARTLRARPRFRVVRAADRVPAWPTCPAAGCSRSAATTGFLALVDPRTAARSSSGSPGHGEPRSRPASAPTGG